MTVLETIIEELARVTDEDIENTAREFDAIADGETVIHTVQSRHARSVWVLSRTYHERALKLKPLLIEAAYSIFSGKFDELAHTYGQLLCRIKCITTLAWAEAQMELDPKYWTEELSMRQGFCMVKCKAEEAEQPEEFATVGRTEVHMIPMPRHIAQLFERIIRAKVEGDADEKKKPKPH